VAIRFPPGVEDGGFPCLFVDERFDLPGLFAQLSHLLVSQASPLLQRKSFGAAGGLLRKLILFPRSGGGLIGDGHLRKRLETFEWPFSLGALQA
jgi:hypothetical protein